MWRRILGTLKTFSWQQWLVAVAFLAVLGFTGLYAYRAARVAAHWKAHADEPIKGWMTVGQVAHSYHVPPHVLYHALGLPNKPPDRRPLLKIAAAQGRSIDDIRAILLDAVVHARPPYPPPTPPQSDEVNTP